MTYALNYDFRLGRECVRIRSSGTGRPLVMVHDLGGSAASFSRLLSAVVAAGRSPVAVDLPGCGHSDTLRTHGLATVVDRLDAVLHRICDGPVDIIGRGFGGRLALTLAARHPDFFEHVIVEDPLLPALGRPVLPRMRSEMAVRGALTTVRGGRLRQNASGYGRAKTLLTEASRPDDAWWRDLERISALTLVLDGRRSDADDRARIMHLTDVLDAATRQNTVDGYGAGYQSLVLDFLARQPERAARVA